MTRVAPMAARAAAAALMLAACGGTGERARDAGPSNALLVIGYDREPDTMNRVATHILEDIQGCIVEPLVVADDSMRLVPVLAREVPTPANGGVRLRADGGMDVTWRLRPGIRWHDGVPFTAADLKFTVEAINDPAWNPESTDGFDRIASVETPDSLTAVLHYRERYAPYALQFVRGALPRHVLAGQDLDRHAYNRNPLGTGPYRLAEWKTGEYILLERVTDYWRGTPAIERLQFRFIPNATTRVTQLAAGGVHLIPFLPWDLHRDVARVPGVEVRRTMGNGYEHVSLNQRRVPAFRDVRVRRALWHAVDRTLLVRTVLDGLAPVVDGAIQPMSWAHAADVTGPSFDPAAAAALLDSAGWRDRDGDGIRDRDGQPLAFTLMTSAGFVTREQVAQALQAQWKAVGVATTIDLVDGTAIASRWFAGDFDAFLHWWQMPADPEITLFFAKDRTPPAGRNINYLVDDSLTTLLYRSDAEIDQGRRRALLVAAQRRIMTLVPEIPLYNTTKLDVVPVGLGGFRGNPTNSGPFWNVHEWRFDR
ncbi:MAG: peptide ABC transporter substrate-binding protein [Gemmatimonadota bacterium]